MTITATATQDTTKAASKTPMVFNKERFEELHKLEVLEEPEEKEYFALRKLRANSITAKKTTIASVIKMMTENSITMLDLKEAGAQVPDLDKMFDKETIKLVAAPMFAGKKSASKGDGTPKEKSTREGNILFEGKTYNWTKSLSPTVETALFTAFREGKSVKEYLKNPSDKASCARLIARFERDTEDKAAKKKYLYSDANLTELSLTRADIVNAQAAKVKADADKAKSDAKKAAAAAATK